MTVTIITAQPQDYDLHTEAPDLIGTFVFHEVLANDALFKLHGLATATAIEERQARLRRELAERSIRAEAGLDRDLAQRINRRAWGINGG